MTVPLCGQQMDEMRFPSLRAVSSRSVIQHPPAYQAPTLPSTPQSNQQHAPLESQSTSVPEHYLTRQHLFAHLETAFMRFYDSSRERWHTWTGEQLLRRVLVLIAAISTASVHDTTRSVDDQGASATHDSGEAPRLPFPQLHQAALVAGAGDTGRLT